MKATAQEICVNTLRSPIHCHICGDTIIRHDTTEICFKIDINSQRRYGCKKHGYAGVVRILKELINQEKKRELQAQKKHFTVVARNKFEHLMKEEIAKLISENPISFKKGYDLLLYFKDRQQEEYLAKNKICVECHKENPEPFHIRCPECRKKYGRERSIDKFVQKLSNNLNKRIESDNASRGMIEMHRNTIRYGAKKK